MKHGISVGAFVLCGIVTFGPLATGQERSQRQDDPDAGLRLRYDDESDRFSLNVSGVGQELRQWWQSWWEDEQRTSRSVSEGAELGARAFLRQHDTDDDGYLSRREMPAGARDEFGRVDRNDDDYLSRNEVRQYGEELYGTQRSQRDSTARRDTSYERDSSRTASRRSQDQEGQSWSEWWSSWFSDGQQSQNRDQRGNDGARQFVRQHDDDGDGYVSRNEMPQRMRDQFATIDRNRDDYLSSSEIRQGGLAQSSTSRQSRSASLSRSRGGESDYESSYGRSGRQSGRSTPVEVAYVWVIDANQGTVQLEDLQKAYEVLSEIDANSDGQLSRRELAQQHEEAVSQWCEQCFTKLDEDGNNRLSRQEAQSSVFASRFDSLDRNSDESLTEQEIRRSMQEQFEARTESPEEETRR